MDKLHYIGYCHAESEREQYKCNVASNIKMHYIASAAQRAGYDVVMVSMCKPKNKFFSVTKMDRSEDVPIKHIAAFSDSSRFANALSLILYWLQILCYLVFSVKKKDTVLVYHSMRLTRVISKLMKLKKCLYVLEVEEIYSYAADGIKEYHEAEINLIKGFQRYIFVNSYIPQYLNIESNKYVVVYGAYILLTCSTEKYKDGKIHVLYAGAIEKLNKGAFTAIEVAELLPKNFIMHVIGKGLEQDVNEAEELINRINRKAGYTKVIYDGFFSGTELDVYMSRCDIGIGTYVIQDAYSNFIFPSKLVSYMCHNLKVVTGRAECYMNIPVSRNWFYYDISEKNVIAEALITAGYSSTEIDNRKIICELDRQLVQNLTNLHRYHRWN